MLKWWVGEEIFQYVKLIGELKILFSRKRFVQLVLFHQGALM
jgi:hypothetical protein